jgi:two-component system sensor histidine kinase PilS (NtrC family)
MDREPLSTGRPGQNASGSEGLVRLQTHLRWMIGVRLVVITSLALPYMLIQLSGNLNTPDFDFLYVFAALAYAASAAYIFLLRFGVPPILQARAQFAGDLLLVTSLVYYFGSASAFSILYLAVIMTAAALLGTRAATTAGTVAWVLYALVSVLSFKGWLIAPAGSSEGITIWVLIYKLGVHLLGFYGVAQLASRLSQGVSQLELELEEKTGRLEELQLRHEDIVQSIPSGLLTTDLGGTITSLNHAGEDILGLTAESMLDTLIWERGLLTPRQWELFTQHPELGTRQRNEIDWPRADGTRHIGFSLTALASPDDAPAGWVLVFQDLTRWRRLEDDMRLKDRMAAVGEMAAGIAHEVGNPLAAISGSVQMLSKAASEDSPQRRLLDIVFKESQRLNRTIKGFLQFARPAERSIIEFDVARMLSENVDLLKNSKEVAPDHQIELTLEPAEARITADPDQISQLFWNLARNALRSMEAGGKLTIAGTLDNGSYSLVFRDTGCGMTENERRKMFHPFQSGFGGGTGVGMAIVYRIVEEHSGRLQVDSEVDHGTVVNITLPARLDNHLLANVGA